MTLMELTGHEAGIIVYPDSKTVAVYWWGNCDDNQIPVMSPLGEPMPWNEGDGIFDGVSASAFKDARELIPGSVWLTDETDSEGNRIADTDLDIVHDTFYDIPRMFLGGEGYENPEDFEGKAYSLNDGRIILALDMWN